MVNGNSAFEAVSVFTMMADGNAKLIATRLLAVILLAVSDTGTMRLLETIFDAVTDTGNTAFEAVRLLATTLHAVILFVTC